ncbi:FAD:protein FMN transferase [Humibacter albus]|uniref:FAD:protein FMN transferase n=1 Tax=Humibacter albus TaxID=427754 RepID=UPI0003B3A6C3|nr:FAD:protein FMN transferase [Humibacter albus]
MRRIRQLMGTAFSLDVRGEIPDELIEQAFDAIEQAEARFSAFLPGSELSRLNRGELGLAETSDDMREVLRLADAFQQASGGAFSARRDGKIDTDGIVKGWAAQRAADLLANGGATDFCLNAGGDIITRGAPEPGRHWQAGIRDPFEASKLLGVLVLGQGALATSGAYERGNHIDDPRTSATPRTWASVSVLDPDLTIADTLATAVYAMGADGPHWAQEEFGVSVITVDHAGHLTITGPVRWAHPTTARARSAP